MSQDAAIVGPDRPADPAATPFVKTVGGKRQLLPELRRHVPESFGRYFEPFVGGGALFFDLVAAGRPGPAWLSDTNRDLAIAYGVVKSDVDALVEALRAHAESHARYPGPYYYAVRADAPVDRVAVAARAIYLNKTCFNGLHRVNRAGKFNVPMGRYVNPAICDEPNLRAVSMALQRAEVHAVDFQSAAVAEEGDFVYFDPPYWPASATSHFTGYTADGFTAADQQRLRDVALAMKRRGVRVLLSNADVPPVRALYADGFECRRVDARRNVNSKPGKRGVVGELLFW